MTKTIARWRTILQLRKGVAALAKQMVVTYWRLVDNYRNEICRLGLHPSSLGVRMPHIVSHLGQSWGRVLPPWPRTRPLKLSPNKRRGKTVALGQWRSHSNGGQQKPPSFRPRAFRPHTKLIRRLLAPSVSCASRADPTRLSRWRRVEARQEAAWKPVLRRQSLGAALL